jgi:LysM repeat protein
MPDTEQMYGRVGLLMAAVGAIVLILLQQVGGEASSGSETVTVRAGDTVWGIASERYPQSDPRGKVDAIMRLNHLQEPILHAGETLKVPAR